MTDRVLIAPAQGQVPISGRVVAGVVLTLLELILAPRPALVAEEGMGRASGRESTNAWGARDFSSATVSGESGKTGGFPPRTDPFTSVVPPVNPFGELPVQHESDQPPVLAGPLHRMPREEANGVRRYRKGFVQRLRLSGSWIDRGEKTNLGLATWEAAATFGVPLGSFENLLLVTPGFEVEYPNGPAQIDVPSELYNAGLDLMWRRKWNDRWGSMIAVAPAVASDFQSSENAIRVTGRALATWQWVPDRVTLIFGVVYLDRNDLNVLPGIGIIWKPTPDYRLDLMFPRPKVAWRLTYLPRKWEDWLYVSGALGGRTWAVERESGIRDQLTLHDYRLSLGWERIVDGGGGLFAEVGWVFDRELEYETLPRTLSFDDAIVLRGGVTY